ncbi:MAG TPA: ABC transporter ATP-binding protein [Steroidobacteraceae bacterium]|nr:ABC transporter ATP-binding protein [Steroidobacteraceae bacterium]
MSTEASPSADRRVLLDRLWRHLSRRRRRQFMAVMGLTAVSAFAEILSLGAVIPFIAVLTQPDRILDWPIVGPIASAAGIHDPQRLVLPLTAAFVVAAIASGAIRLTLLWVSARVTFAAGADLSSEVYRRTLYQPYSVHVERNSSEIISGITNKVGGTVLGVMFPLMTLISAMVSLLATLATLLVIDPALALAAGAGFGLCYGVITGFSRNRLRINGRRIATEHTLVVKTLQEGLGGIRDVLLDGSQPLYYEVYRRAERALRRAQGGNVFMAQSPRFSMEAIGMVLIAMLAFGISRHSAGVAAALPVLGALAVGAQRLLPALQQVYAAWASIAGSHALLQDTLSLLDQPLPPEASAPAPSPLRFEREIRMEQVNFRYTAHDPWVIHDLSLVIPRGARVGLVGTTGSGKSTTLDLLMGLLQPSSGRISIDGRSLDGGLVRAWQAAIAHVPQSIFLADTTFTTNIAFGLPSDQVDFGRVRRAAELARIADFIDSMPDGFDSVVGERGVRLSGGQRQRIGIARALYKQASILVLDEATSALDNNTERSVMDAIEGLSEDLTIIMIAHRVSTVLRCDTIAELEQGRLVAQAPFQELLAISESFRRMAAAGNFDS